jgi:hypothetical protein
MKTVKRSVTMSTMYAPRVFPTVNRRVLHSKYNRMSVINQWLLIFRVNREDKVGISTMNT